MQSKTKTYILLAFVLGIWGVIAYKIMGAINPVKPKINKETFGVSFTPNNVTTLDTFSIQTNERDPFLGTLYKKKKPITKKTKKQEFVWIPVLYHGSVTQQTSKNKVFVISIKGEQILMKAGQTLNEITLIKGDNNQITVGYKGARKTINKL